MGRESIVQEVIVSLIITCFFLPPEPTGKMLALRRSLDADAHRPVRIFRLLLPSVWAQHGAEALADAFDELSGAFRSQTPLTFVL